MDAQFPRFFVGKPVMLDLAAVTLSEPAIAHLVDQLAERGIRIMGLEGVDPAALGPNCRRFCKAAVPAARRRRPSPPPEDRGAAPPEASAAAAPQRQEPVSMLLESPIRSGQSVNFPFGDVTVLGSVASGAEIVAGGSIHIYGALRGRAMAGSMGDARARIFCSRNEAELLAIDGYYQTAENMDASLRGRPVQVWLEAAGLTSKPLTAKPWTETAQKGKQDGQSLSRHIRQGRGRQDDVHGRARCRFGAIRPIRRGGRFRRGPAQSRSGDGGGAARGLRPDQRGAGRRQAAAGSDPRQAHRDVVAAAGLADPRQGCLDGGGRRAA